MEQFDISAAEKRKSFLITVVIYAFLLLLLFFIRFWPPTNPETLAMLGGGGGGGGVTINFGDSDVGMGDNFQSEVLNVKNDVKQTVTESAPENIISSDTPEDNAVVIPKNPTPVKTKPVVKTDPKPVEVIKPTVSKNTNDALANLMNGSNKGGDGDDNQAGNKGKSNGDLASNGYYGNGGSGGGTGGGTGTGNGMGTGPGSGSGSGGGNGSGVGTGTGGGYSLGNRKALSKPAPNYNCNEEGRVVVEVSVDKTGKTIAATPGIKGTTNTAKCLLDQARIAAMNTRWQASDDAPDRQVGKIIYTFSLN